MMFECDRCGQCCRHLELSSIYADLDRGDGICRFLEGNLCSIYAERPLLCNVDASYYEFFKDIMPIEAYYQINHKMCERLKEMK